jgi:transposase
VALAPAETRIVQRIRRARLFVWWREHRPEPFDEAFQAGLAATSADSARGQPPAPPAQLAVANLLPAYVGCSDDEVIEAATMDRRRQLARDCLAAEAPPFCKGTLVAFHQRRLARQLDRRLIARTVEPAAARGGLGPGPLRAALDSSPLGGAGRGGWRIPPICWATPYARPWA